MKKIYIISSIIFLLISIKTKAQVDNTLYYMTKIPEASFQNPAINSNCKIYVSGLGVPLAGQILPAMHFNYDNNSFAYRDAIYKGSGALSDSLVTAFNSVEDGNKFIDKLHKRTYLRTELDINLLSVGYKYKDYYFSVGVRERIEARASFSHDLIQLAHEGNGAFLGKDADIGGFGATMTHFREYDLGASKKINNKLTVGVRAKLLFGKENLWTKKNNLTWNTNETDYAYNFDADMEFHTSSPIYKIDKFDYDFANDSLIFEDTIYENIDTKDVIMNNKNFGLGIDLGAIYKYNDKITLYASVTDLGYIKWKTNTSTFKVNGKFTFDGYDIQPYFTENDSVVTANNENFKDSVLQIFMPQYDNESYISHLTPKFFIGGTYKFTDKINAGILARGEVYQNKLHSSLTLSGNTNFKKWFSASLSYSIMNNSFTNLGIGLMAKAGFAQFYVVTDNILAIWPQAARTVNFRMGINLLFGCKLKENNSLIKGASTL